MAKPRLPLPERFMQYVEPEPMSGCHLWIGGTYRCGYGAFNFGPDDPGGRRSWYAHRAAWAIFCGPVPRGMFVLHKCDVRLCVSVDHLFIGSASDNALDMASKWRGHASKQGMPFGVNWSKDRARPKPYSAQVGFRGKRYNLGRFATPGEASAVAIAFKEKCYREGAPQ